MKIRPVFLLRLATAGSGLAFALGASPASAAATALNCRADRSPVNVTICASPEYVAMVREIDALTDRAMTRFGATDRRRLAQSQVADYRRRQGCAWSAHHSAHPGTAVDECVRASLEDRVHALRVLVERGAF